MVGELSARDGGGPDATPASGREQSAAGTRPRLLAIVGPTAAGKSELAVEVAARRGGEVVSVDSRQVYRRLDIGTAKASPAMQASVRHHLVDVVDPDEEYDAARFAADARAAIADAQSRGKAAILCGGSGLYLQALTEGLAPLPKPDEGVRAALRLALAEDGADALRRELEAVDPAAAARIAPADHVRMLRALEVWRQTGRALSDWQEEHRFRDRPWDLVVVDVCPTTAVLDDRIRQRAGRMWDEGLVEETRAVLADGFDGTLPALQAIGYREAQAFLQGEMTAETAVEEIAKASRRYAKRQRTWFRRYPDACRVEQGRLTPALAERLQAALDPS